MKKRAKRKEAARNRIPVVSAQYRRGDCLVEVSVSEEAIREGKRYRLSGSVTPPQGGALTPIVPEPVFWSWAFREDDLDALVFFLAIELGYEVEDNAPESATIWVVWSEPKHVFLGWALGPSTGRVAVPRSAATRILSALATAAGWELAG